VYEVAAAPGANARYERLRCIGRGGNGVVYEVFDHLRKRRLALKTLAQSTPASLLSFKQEFRTLAELRHPNLVRLHELVSPAEGAEFFTMELVIGQDFRQYARQVRAFGGAGSAAPGAPTVTAPITIAQNGAGPSPLPPRFDSTPARLTELRAALHQLAAGLRALHSAGKLHRDIKPSNVMVSTEGRVVILDFGLSTGLSHRETSEDVVAGTPAYMAPEQVLNEALQPASDWYAVGVLLFDALVGRAPFQGSLSDVLSQKLTLESPRPSQLVSGVPADLDELCALLLSRDPLRRPSGKQIAERLSSVDGSISVRPSISRPRLVGRERELDALERAFARACEHGPAVVVVHGPSGIGKSSLLSHFSERLGAEGRAEVLCSRVYEQEAIPYKAVDAILDSLSEHLEAAERRGLELPPTPDLQALGQLFPVLRRLPAFASERAESPADPLRLRERAFDGLRLVLEQVTREKPMVWVIDDVQWGDSDSASLLVEVLGKASALPLLLVLSHRERTERSGAFLAPLIDEWAGRESLSELEIGALSELDVRQLLAGTLLVTDDLAEGVVERVFQMSTGNPFLAQELAYALVPSAAQLSAEVTVSPRGPGAFETLLLDERLRGLDASALRLLELVAACGRGLPTEMAAAAAGIASQIDAVVGALSQRRLVRSSYEGGLEVLEIRHDRIRNWILSRLSEAELSSRHRSLAQTLEAAPHSDPDLWIEHWLRTGDSAEIRRVALPAAARAAERLAFGRAEALYRAALSHIGVAAETIAVYRELGRVLEWDGRGADAAQAYLRAAELSSGFERSALESSAGLLSIYAGRFTDGSRLLRSSLRELDLPAPAGALGALGWLVIGRLRLSRLESRLAKAPRCGTSEASRARVEVLHAAAFGFVFTDPLLGECSQAAHLHAALEGGTAQQTARALALEASQRAHRSLEGTKSAERLFELAEKLAERGDDPAYLEFVRACRGVSQFLCGNWRASHELLGAAYRDVPRHTAGWHTTAWIYDVLSLCNQGRFDLVAEVLPGLLDAAAARGDRFTETSLRVCASVPLRLARGDSLAARAELRAGMTIWDQPKFLVQHWRAMWWGAETELYEGRGAAARERYQRDARRLSQSFLLRVQYIRAMTAFVRARAALATFDEDPRARRQEIEALRKELAAEGRSWTTVLGAMLGAALSLRSGETELGVRGLESALALAERADMSGHAEACRWLLGERLSGAEGANLRRAAEAALTRHGVREPERFARSLLPL